MRVSQRMRRSARVAMAAVALFVAGCPASDSGSVESGHSEIGATRHTEDLSRTDDEHPRNDHPRPSTSAHNEPPSTNSGTTTDETSTNGAAKKRNSSEPAVTDQTPVAPLKARMPKVVMSEEQRAACLVFVGDRLPETTLPDLDGQEQRLHDLLASRATIVVFWSSENPYSVAELHELATRIVDPLSGRGIKLVGINVGDSPEVVRRTVESLGVGAAELLDRESSYFSKVATAYLPRTFLVDADGMILWLDIEYSRATYRQLRRAVLSRLDEERTALR